MTRKLAITAAGASPPAGPYSPAITIGDLVFVSGQLPADPATGAIVEGPIELQTQLTLHNLAAVLTGAGTSLDKLVKTTVYLLTRSDWAAMNSVYADYVGPVPPARCTVVVSELAPGARVEIEAVAHL